MNNNLPPQDVVVGGQTYSTQAIRNLLKEYILRDTGANNYQYEDTINNFVDSLPDSFIHELETDITGQGWMNLENSPTARYLKQTFREISRTSFEYDSLTSELQNTIWDLQMQGLDYSRLEQQLQDLNNAHLADIAANLNDIDFDAADIRDTLKDFDADDINDLYNTVENMDADQIRDLIQTVKNENLSAIAKVAKVGAELSQSQMYINGTFGGITIIMAGLLTWLGFKMKNKWKTSTKVTIFVISVLLLLVGIGIIASLFIM